MNCEPSSLIEASRCFKCIPPGSLAETQIYLLCSWANAAGGEAIVRSWVERVIANGGEEPEQDTQDAILTFANGLIAANLHTKMIAVNCFVPDSFIACTTPLIVGDTSIDGMGVDPWTNSGFIAGDVSLDGLKGNTAGGGKTLRTGLKLPVCFSSPNSAGISLYQTFSDTSTRHDMAIADNSGARLFQLLTCYDAGQTAYFDCFNDTTGRASGPALPGGRGYTSGNRVSATDSRIYIANSSVIHQQTGATQVGAPGTLFNTGTPNATLPVFCMFDGTVAPGQYLLPTAKRFSYASVHLGFSQAESLAEYTLVQALRTTLGGGFV